MLRIHRHILSSLIFIAIFLSFGCTAINETPDNWFGKDKLYHVAVAGAIGTGVTAYAQNKQNYGCRAPLIGISTVIAVGATKETYDLKIKKTYWSWKDMFWNVVGGTLGSLAVSKCK